MAHKAQQVKSIASSGHTLSNCAAVVYIWTDTGFDRAYLAEER